MALHDLPDARQAHTGARKLPLGMQPLERVEQLVPVSGIEARAVVADVAADVGIPSRRRPELEQGIIPAGREFPGVIQQVLQDRADEARICQRPGWLLDGEADAAVRALALEFPGDAGHFGTEINRPQADPGPRDAGQLQQVVEKLGHVLAGGLDPPGVTAAGQPHTPPAAPGARPWPPPGPGSLPAARPAPRAGTRTAAPPPHSPARSGHPGRRTPSHPAPPPAARRTSGQRTAAFRHAPRSRHYSK